VDVPEMPNDVRFEPVLSDSEHAQQKKNFMAIVGGSTTGPPSPQSSL
jgi:hypothetical protein